MVKFYGEPNHPVSMIKRLPGNRRRVIHLFSFDDNGCYNLDETSISKEALKRLKVAFKWSEIARDKKETKKEVETKENTQDLTKMKFFELKKLAKEKGMEIETSTKKKEILKYLKEVM